MIGREKRMLLRHYMEQGMSITALAQQLGISRDTIHRWIRNGELDRDLDAGSVRYRPRAPVPTKLDPYKAIIQARLDAYPELSGVRLLEEARAAGYTGGYTQLKEYVRSIRPAPTPEPVIRFETPPGHQAQVDFARFRFPWGVRYALLVVLGYSRVLWLRFYRRQDMRTLITGLEDAFTFFGGVPQELLFDQMKTVITRDLRLEGGALVRNAEFLRFAHHWGFTPRACRPYRAQTKGKVERPVRYVRGNFVYGREFLNDADLDHHRAHWLERVANVRVHRTIKERPMVRFERDERLILQPSAPRLARTRG
ncbi:MAG: IS21 family transposase [Longimicrobiales bacterium]